LIAGDATEGYFGTLTAAEFINGTALATAIGLTAGGVISSQVNSDWQKFIWQGKILYMPMQGFRNTVTWNQLYARGAIYGDDTNGAYPAATPVAQSARATVGNRTFRVRVPKTAIGNSVPLEVGSGSGTSGRVDNHVTFKGSEWNQLMYRSTSGIETYQAREDWAAYTGSQLSAGWTIMQESSSQNTGGCVMRSYPGFGMGSGLCVSKGLSAASVTWKPVLELIQP
jgi:hypothetical protein